MATAFSVVSFLVRVFAMGQPFCLLLVLAVRHELVAVCAVKERFNIAIRGDMPGRLALGTTAALLPRGVPIPERAA
jgi:hypothetical protein